MAVQINISVITRDGGKAVEDYRSPKCCARNEDFRNARSVLE